jgi:antitoxin component YwqK of YwqJK toxin-antitoxin module
MPASLEASAPPPEAVLDAETGAWEVCERDAEGRRDGECRIYREDGSLKLHCLYRAGVLCGPFTEYHPGGATARQGEFVAGKLHGPVTRFAGDQLGSEPLRACCVPPGATELRSSYLEGQLLRERFVDAAGRPLSSDGTPWPERAAEVPEDAEFDRNADRWCVRSNAAGANEYTVRYYGLDGRLLEEIEIASSRRRTVRCFDASGALIEEQRFDEQGAAAGRWYRRHSSSSFADPRIVAEEATMQAGFSIAESRFFDAGGTVVRVVDRGSALEEAALLSSPALAEGTPEADSGLVESLVLAGRIREAVCAAARRLAHDHDVERFHDLLARFVVRLTPEAGVLRAQAAEGEETSSALVALEALLLGGDPARVLRLLASTLAPTRRAALDLVNAALCLDPTSVRAHVTRALIRLERGDIEGALADAEVVARESEATAAALRELCRLQFPVFSFWPDRDPVAAQPALDAITLDQPLAAIRRVVQLYATRLSALRAALIARVSAVPGAGVPAWLPPDVSNLLPDGPLELTAYSATITDEADGITETNEVAIDERVVTTDLGVPALMRMARGDWAALTWLCWASGLDRVALPEDIAPPAEFATAADRAVTRCFRAHDQLRSGGLISHARGVPGFSWEGLDVAELSPALAEVAAAETLEIRALFFWLLFEQNLSPFQNDLRRV